MDDLDAGSGLQRERTELGWRRTGLAAVGLTGVFVRARVERLDALAALFITLSAAVVLAVLWSCYHRPEPRDGRVPALVTALIAVIAVAQLAAVAFD